MAEYINHSIKDADVDEIAQKALECIYNYHTTGKCDGYAIVRPMVELYDTVSEKIIEDGLMTATLYNITPEGRTLRELGSFTKNLIRDFDTVSNAFYDQFHYEDGVEHFTVFRSQKGPFTPDMLVPFSTAMLQETILSDRLCDSGGTELGNDGFYIIKVPITTRLLCLKNDAEGKEIVLPAGVLTLQKEDIVTSYLTACPFRRYMCVFHPN